MQFKKWFGDWQNAPQESSKIVNADGTPKIMYQGSKAKFTIFDKSKARSSGLYGKGFYFSDQNNQAGVYGDAYSVYLNIRNPLTPNGTTVSRDQVRSFIEAIAENEDYSIENYGTYDIDTVLDAGMGQEQTIDAFKVIQDLNATAIGDMVEGIELFNQINGTTFDGIVVPTETVAFYPEQIKSATDNIGTYDGADPNINHSFSPVEGAEEGAVSDTASSTAARSPFPEGEGNETVQDGPPEAAVSTDEGAFVPAEKPGKVRLKDPFVNAPKELWDMAQRISEITGREIVLFREEPGEHGIHDGYEENGILYINVLSYNPQATIWSHEYCHSFEKTREHESLKKGLRKLFLRKGIDMEAQIREKQAFYKRNGVDIPMDEAGRVKLENEVVAAYTSKLFTSVDDIQAMVEFNPTIIQRLSHWVDSVLAAFGNKNAAERTFLYNAKKLYQKALSGGTALKNQTEYRDTSAEFNARRQELETMLADGQITDEEYESGMEALDEEQLLQEGRTEPRQTKTKPPARQTTPTDGVKHSFIGYDSNTGKGIYEGNFPKGMPKKAKSERILQLIQDVWSKKPIRLVISNGEKSRTIYARFDPYIDPGENIPTDASKIAGGNRHGNHTEQRVTLDLGEDYYQIASEASYNYSKMETGKSLETHNDVIMWHYFVNDILFAEQGSTDLTPYTVTINVKEKTDGDYVYSFSAEKESSTQRTLHAAVNTHKGANGELFLNNIISDSNKIVKDEADYKNHSFSPVEGTEEGSVTDADGVAEQARQQGYPEINGQQIVPGQTWVLAQDIRFTQNGKYMLDENDEPVRNHNYGVVVGKRANGYLLVKFGKGKTVPIAQDDLTPVPGRHADAAENIESLMKSEPIFMQQEDPISPEEMAAVLESFETDSGTEAPEQPAEVQTDPEQVNKDRQDIADSKGYIVEHTEAEYHSARQGYPVLKGVQVVPNKTWVLAEDIMYDNSSNPVLDENGQPRRHHNYGIITGMDKNGRFLVSFRNKSEVHPETGKTVRVDDVSIAAEDLTPTEAMFQRTHEDWESLMDSMPIDPDSEEYTPEQIAEIMKEYERAWQEEHSAKPKEWTPVNRTELPAKAEPFLAAAERKLRNYISKALSVPPVRNKDYLNSMVQEIADEVLQTGQVSDETLTRVFDEAFELGVKQDRQFYDDYKHIKDHLRTTAVTLREQDRADIADYDDFRRRAAFKLLIKNEGGLPVDTAYDELRDMAPELFPENITHPADQLQRMYDVADSIRIVESSLKNYYRQDADDFKRDTFHDFSERVSNTIKDLKAVARYALDKQKKEASTGKPLTLEEAMEVGKKMKQAMRQVDRAVRKNLLTFRDEQQVGRLLSGDILPSDLDSGNENVEGILAVYEAKKEYEQYAKQFDSHRKSQRAKRRDLAKKYLTTVLDWNDKGSGIAYSRETMWRNIQDIVPDPALARQINEEYFFAVNRAEAKSTKFKNDFRNRVRKLNLSRKVEKGNLVSEAHAVQLYGEALDNIRVLNEKKYLKTRDGMTLSEWQAVLQKLWAENPNLDHAKIQNAVNEFRKIYDELFSMMNEVRVRNGYEPVNYRQGYFPHFQPGEESVIAQFGKVFGIEQVDVLPTTINGLTHMFKPGTQWFGSTQERIGFATAYDALEGFDRYIEGISGVIHQTDNIQKLRALASQIRYMASKDGIREQVDKAMADTRLTEEEKQVQVADIYEKAPCALSKFVTELDEYTNLLANKKSRYDRTVETLFDRKLYNIMRKWESRVAANMVGGNLGSALTNLIPLTQAFGRLKTGSMLKGMFGTLKAYITGDGIESMSDFLTNRRGSDPIVRNWMQATSNVMGKPMEFFDSFVSGSIIRAAYYQYKSSGMSDQNAIHCADLLGASIMADRSKGSMPTIFHSYNPIIKNFTQFQLEVNNQISEIMKDLPRAYRGRKLALTAAYTRYFIGAWLFNLLYQLIAGRKPALDPIDMLWSVGKDIADGKKAAEVYDGLKARVLESLPFTSGLTLFGFEVGDSRLPVSSSIPDIPGMLKDAANGNWNGFFTELQKPITYNLPTGGGGQLAKTYKGVKAFIEGGSYTKDKDGNDILQYPIYNDSTGDFIGNLLKSAFFGKSSTKEAQNWVESDFDSTSAQYTAVYQALLDCGVKDREAYKTINDFQKITGDNKAARQREFVLKSDLNDDAKKIIVGVILGTDMETETGNPSAYAKYLSCLEYGLSTDEYLQMVLDGGDADRFLKIADAGVDVESSTKITVAIGQLEPEEGKKQVSDQQRWRAVIQTVDDSEQQLAALSTMMSDSQYTKCSVAYDHGLDPDLWVMMQEVLPMYDADENGAYNQEEITKAINGVGGDLGARVVAGWWGLDIAKGYRHMSKKEKAVLWQLLTGSPSAKNNPYDVTTGEKVLKKYKKLRDDQKDDEE